MNKDLIGEFCQNHGIQILDQNKRAHRFRKVNTQYFSYEYDYNKINHEVIYDTEPLYTVEIAESELEKIAEFENQVFNNMRTHGHYGIFNAIMEQKEREKNLKERYPAVKKAYEHYSLMLKLAESGEL